MERDAGERGGHDHGQRGAGQHGRDRAGARAARAQQRDGAAALARGHGQPLDERVEADEPDREPDAAQHAGQHAEEGGVARGRGARPSAGRRAEVAQAAPRPRARSAPGSSRTASSEPRPGSAASRRVGADVGEPAVALERAHDAGHAEAHLGAAAGLHGERRARAQPERVGEPDAHLGLARRAQPPALGERRRLEARVVAGVGDEPQRLAEPERVGHVGRRSAARRRPRRGSRGRRRRTSGGSRAVSW